MRNINSVSFSNHAVERKAQRLSANSFVQQAAREGVEMPDRKFADRVHLVLRFDSRNSFRIVVSRDELAKGNIRVITLFFRGPDVDGDRA